MKNAVERLMSGWSKFLACLLAIFATTGAWAADPVAVWDRDFSTMTKGVYTLSENGNTKTDSYLQISGDNGVLITSSENINNFTVIVRCSGLNLSSANTQVLFTANETGPNNTRPNLVGVNLPANNAACRGIWAGAAWDPTSSTAGYSQYVQNQVPANYTTLIYNHQQTNGNYAYALGPTSDVDDTVVCTTLYSIVGLRSSGSTYNGCAIGGLRGTTSATLLPATGLRITSIAVFSGTLTEAEMKSYFFPSEIQTITVNANTSVSAINAQLDDENYKAIAVSAADGVTITVDEAFGHIISVSSEGNVILAAASQPAASYFSGVDFSGVQGALVRSWITSNVVGFNFRSNRGSDVSGALVTADSWIHDNNSANGTSTAMFADGLSTLTWASSTTYYWNSTTILDGYLDDGSKNGNGAEVHLANVPYATYDIILYCSSDQPSGKHLAKTVNGTTYTWDSTGSTTVAGNGTWGATQTSTPAYGTNTLRIKDLTGPLTIYGGVKSGGNRGGIAAFEIVNRTHIATIDATDDYTLAGLFTSMDSSDYYVINVNESATLNIGSATTVGSITFNVASGKTLTLTGSATLTATTINVNGAGMVAMTSSVLRGTVKGNGTLYYNGVRPTTSGTDVILTDSDWRGTVRITYNYINTATGTARQLFPQHWGSANSKIMWNGVVGYFGGCTSTAGWILEDLTVDATTYPALRKNDGGSSATTTAPSLEGSGEFADASNPSERFHFATGSSFSGKINITSSAGYGMNVQFGETAVAKVERTIHVLSGATVNVAAGKTWSAPGGIVVNGTLNVGAGSTIPAIVSGSTGVVQITSSGTATISGVQGNAIPSSLAMVGGNIAVADTGITELTIPAETGVTFFSMANGKLDLSGCTSLTTLKLNLGSGTTFDLANVILPASCTTVRVDVGSARTLTGYTISNLGTATLGFSATETKEEYANGTFSVSNVPSGATVSVTRADGTTSNAIVTDGTARLSDYGTVKISGAATVFDISYTNSFAIGYNVISASSGHDGWWTNPAQNPTYNNEANDTTTGMHIKWHPYISGTGSKISEFQDHLTLVAVGTMSPTANRIFLHLGSSSNSNKGILILTGANKDEVYIAYNSGTTITLITTTPMTVPNAATARHSYIVTKEDAAGITTFTVYLDGIKWKTTSFPAVTLGTATEIQVGSDISGSIKNDASGTYKAVDINADTATETGVINTIRLYDRIITPAEIAEYAAVYPYVSPNGSSSRTFTEATENWIDTTESSTVWENSSEEDSGTPTEDASVTVTAAADTTISVNLAEVTEYEGLTINGSSVTFAPANASSGAIKVTGMTVIGTTVTNEYGAVDMTGGPMTITEDGDITFDYSEYDISAIYTTTDIPLTSDVDENSTKVHLIAPSASYRTVSLVYTSGHYVMRVTPDHEAGSEVYYTGGYWGTTESTFAVTNASGAATIVLSGDTVVIPAYHDGTSAYFGATLPANVSAIRVEKNFTFESGVDNTAILGGATVTVAEGCTLSFATSCHNLTLGAVTFNGPGGVSIPTLSSTASIAGAVSGTATLTIGGTVTVPSTGSIANTVVGDGRIVFVGALPTSSTLLTSLQDSSSWTGTVELKNYTQTTEIDAHKIINLGNYGNSSSTVALNGVTSTMYTGNNTYPDVTLGAIEIGEGGWSDNDGLSYTVSPLYAANLTGSGTITVKTGYEGTVKFIGNHTFDGSVAFGVNTGKQVAFMKTASDTLPSVTAKTIVVAGRTNMSIASGKTWTADAIKIDGSLTVLTAEKATATSVVPTAYLDGATITTTVDGEAGTTTYVTDEVTQISDNQASLGAVTVSESKLMTGSGGAYMSSLTINDGATLTYDPVITPLRVESAPVFNGTGKLKLAPRYAGVTCGKFHLVTYPSSASVSGTLHDLVDSTSFDNATYTMTEETVGDYKQLVLKVGDYDNDAKEMTIAQFGDSITEGIIRDGYRGTPNYRIPLMQLLEAYGYKPTAKGYRKVGSTDANGVPADSAYEYHTGISAQRIYTGLTDGSLRAGFMESIEAHLEQVGVTDIITLKIGTNDSIGGETAENMFEGWSNLVWKIVRMRPTSKIVVCAPVKIRKGNDYNAPGLRTKIAEYVAKTAAQGGFPDGQVTMINGFDVVTDDANYYLTDNVHPNWNGHLQLANAWLPAVTNAFEGMAARATVNYTAQTVASAETATELADYRAGYVKLATFSNVKTKLSAWGESPYASVNATYKDTPMSRVAYFVARKTTASLDTRYVWVDMDTDATTGTTLAQFGVPTNSSVNGVVNNLHIYSNSSAIENVAPTVSGVKGTLMLTDKGVSKTNGISTDLAPDGPYGFDWNDSIYAEGAWGVMNVARIFDGATPTDHRKLLAAQMLFDFNGFNGSRQNALGIGDFAVHGPYNTANGSVDNFNLNWTFTTAKDEMPTMDARALETGVIEIWGKPILTVTVPSVEHATATVNDEPVAGGNSVQFDYGADVTIEWTADSGYKITDGATQTINDIAVSVTATAPTVEKNSVSFSNYAVEYTADYTKAATITATVTGDDEEEATYTLKVGEDDVYEGSYSDGTVTFQNITNLSLGATLSYTISAYGTTTSGSSGVQTSTVGNAVPGWLQEDATHNKSTGTWETDIAYSAGVATITDNTYTPTKPGDGIVTLTTVVKFGDDADPEVAVGTAQAALRVQNGVFEVYGKTTSEGAAGWQTTSVDADSEATYRVVIVVNYTTGTFTMTVAKGEAAAQSLGGPWYLATSADKVSAVAYKGTGEFTSLVGSFISSDIEVTVETADDVSVSGDFIRDYLGSKTVSEASALLAPDSTTTASNGYNYFSNYALGLNPTDKEDKPTIKVETNSEGKFVVTLVDGNGDPIVGAANVALTLKFQSGTDPNSLTTETISSFSEGSATIDPSTMEDNVQYYKVQVNIGAK